MEEYLSEKERVVSFSKPDTAPNSLKPSTTSLSPYLKFGCVSAALFYEKLDDLIRKHRNATSPPVSLIGQLYWREYFYSRSFTIPNFDRIEGNSECRQIKWDENDEYVRRWENG